MRNFLSSLALVALVAGCEGMPIPLPGGGSTVIYSSPQAGALRGCATVTDVVTPGVSPAAVADLMRGSAATLGATPEEALKNCLTMLQAIPD